MMMHEEDGYKKEAIDMFIVVYNCRKDICRELIRMGFIYNDLKHFWSMHTDQIGYEEIKGYFYNSNIYHKVYYQADDMYIAPYYRIYIQGEWYKVNSILEEEMGWVRSDTDEYIIQSESKQKMEEKAWEVFRAIKSDGRLIFKIVDHRKESMQILVMSKNVN